MAPIVTMVTDSGRSGGGWCGESSSGFTGFVIWAAVWIFALVPEMTPWLGPRFARVHVEDLAGTRSGKSNPRSGLGRPQSWDTRKTVTAWVGTRERPIFSMRTGTSKPKAFATHCNNNFDGASGLLMGGGDASCVTRCDWAAKRFQRTNSFHTHGLYCRERIGRDESMTALDSTQTTRTAGTRDV